MKNIFGLLLFLTAPFLLQAQDDKAKKILDELSVKNKSYNSISADFTFTLEDKIAGVNQKQEGEIFMKGNKFNLHLGDHHIISDGTTRWTVNKESNEVYIDNVTDSEESGSLNPNTLFTVWETGFKHYYVEQTTENGKTLDVIKLVPVKPDEKTFHTIRLFVDQSKMQLNKIEILGKEGDNYTYAVRSFETNKSYSDADFTFNAGKYPGIEKIDNR